MPQVSREDRYNLLLIPENEFNVLNPHPHTQTLYTYPFSTPQITIPLNSAVIVMWMGHWFAPNSPIAWIAFAIQLILIPSYILAHPGVGSRRRRLFDTPDGVEQVQVRRPYFGRKKCQTMYGVTGGCPYKEYIWRLTGTKYKVRHEPAYWVIDL